MPDVPDTETREHLLAVLADFVSRSGYESLLLPPVQPGDSAFPEPWAPTRAGVVQLLRRLAWHAKIDREIEVIEERIGAMPTERKPSTRVELLEVRGTRAVFELSFIGTDEIAGTLAHEIGLVHAVLYPADGVDPYRTAEPPVLEVDVDNDPERGSIATVYLGLGVLAANAAYQQYSRGGQNNGAYEPLEYDVVQSSAVPMSALAYLLAVQAVVRRSEAPPRGLAPPQRDETAAWIEVLASQRRALCDQLGIPPDAQPGERPRVVPFAPIELADGDAPRRTAFRWQTNRGGVGFLAGTVLGIGLAFGLSRGVMAFTALGGAAAGHLVGRRVRTPRCSACATVVRADAISCRHCGAHLRGDIAHLNQRLEAEEHLEDRL